MRWRSAAPTLPGATVERVTRIEASCADGSEVVEHRLDGAGHVWPDQDSHGVDAIRTIAEFFAANGRYSVSSVDLGRWWP